MHRARLTIDLPSEDLPPDPALVSVLRWIFTTAETKALERVTGTGLSWCHRLLAASAHGGLTDVVAIIADDTELYLDERRQHEDFADVLDAVVRRGGLKGGFSELRVVLSGESGDWHALADIRLRMQVDKGDPEIDIHWSARSLALRMQADEDPVQYRARIAALAADGSAAKVAFATPDTMLDGLVTRWTDELAPAVVGVTSRRHVVVVPGPTQVGRFRKLGFGRALRQRSYRPRATEKRVGEYDEPHVYYYFDPYHDLLSWLLGQEIAAGRWQGPSLELVDRHGKALAPGAAWEVAMDAVELHEDRVAVASTVPEVLGLDVAEAGSPSAPGFAGGSDDG
ncbi:MAG: hypothetical protein AAF721_26725 [Myxococcota bacterium]